VRRRAPIAFLVAVALGSGALGAAVAHGDRPPDAEIFATSTTAIIIDPADPRLQDRLLGFRREVQRIIRRGGGVPRRSRLVDDHAERRRDPVDAVEVEVPGVDAQRLRFGFVADAEARQRLMGGSVTLGGRLVLVTGLGDLPLVERFATALGGRYARAKVRPGRREFVSG
jgi:hypothetical protein